MGPLRLSHLTPLRMLRQRSRIRKVSHPISRDSSSLESSSRTEELFQITTSRRNLPSISYSDFVVVCRSSSRPSPVRPSPSKSSHLTPSRTSRPRSKTRKVSHLTSRDSSSQESNLRMAGPPATTTSRKSPPSISCSDSVVVCRSSLRPRTRRASLPISRDLSSPESSSRTAGPLATTTSRRSPPSILCLDFVEASEVKGLRTPFKVPTANYEPFYIN